MKKRKAKSAVDLVYGIADRLTRIYHDPCALRAVGEEERKLVENVRSALDLMFDGLTRMPSAKREKAKEGHVKFRARFYDYTAILVTLCDPNPAEFGLPLLGGREFLTHVAACRKCLAHLLEMLLKPTPIAGIDDSAPLLQAFAEAGFERREHPEGTRFDQLFKIRPVV